MAGAHKSVCVGAFVHMDFSSSHLYLGNVFIFIFPVRMFAQRFRRVHQR